MRKFSYIWVTLILFIFSLAGYGFVGWHAFVNEQRTQGLTPEVSNFLLQAGRDTLENWQSEFLQLIWQVAGLSFLYCVGSPQSREGDDRREEKINELLKAINPQGGEEIVRRIDEKYSKGSVD